MYAKCDCVIKITVMLILDNIVIFEYPSLIMRINDY